MLEVQGSHDINVYHLSIKKETLLFSEANTCFVNIKQIAYMMHITIIISFHTGCALVQSKDDKQR